MSSEWTISYGGDFVYLRAKRLVVNGSEVLPANGTVTSVGTGVGLTGGPITTVGTIDLADTAVIPGSYTLMSGTVDAQGRMTAASSGVAVTSVGTGTGLTGGPITTTGTVNLADTAVTPGSYTYTALTVDAQGRLTAAASGAPPTGTVTSVGSGTGLTGGPITTSGTLSIADTTVVAGSYSIPTFTVNAQGQLTAASSTPLPLYSLSSGTNTTSGRYILFGGQATTFDGGAMLISRAGNITSLTCRTVVAPGVGASRTFTLYVNAIATAMTVTISGASTTGSITTNIAVSVLDQIALLHTSAGVPAASITQATLEYLP